MSLVSDMDALQDKIAQCADELRKLSVRVYDLERENGRLEGVIEDMDDEARSLEHDVDRAREEIPRWLEALIHEWKQRVSSTDRVDVVAALERAPHRGTSEAAIILGALD